MSLPGKTETENKQSVDNSLLDRVATVDSDLSVRFCVQQIVSCCFSTLCHHLNDL